MHEPRQHVPADQIAEGVGQKHAGDQKHDVSYKYLVQVLPQAAPAHEDGQAAAEEGAHDIGEYPVDVDAVEAERGQVQNPAHDGRSRRIPQVAAEKQGEGGGNQRPYKAPGPDAVGRPAYDLLKPRLSLLRRQLMAADLAGEVVDLIQLIHVGLELPDAPGLGLPVPVLVQNRHNKAGGHTEHMLLPGPVGHADAPHRVLHAADLRPVFQKLFPDIHGPNQRLPAGHRLLQHPVF